MKLQQAVVDYGLTTLADVMLTEDMPLDEASQRRLVLPIIRVLSSQWLVIAPPAVTRTHDGSAIRFEGLAGCTPAGFSWDYTEVVRDENSWACGLVEAVFRRWMNMQTPFLSQLNPLLLKQSIPTEWPCASTLR